MAFPVDESFVEAAERQLNRPIPPDLRQRLMQNNGGEIVAGDEEWQLFPVWDSTDRKRMGRTSNHIVKETQEARKWRSFPTDAVAIAANGMGDLLIVRATSDMIELWDHETGEAAPVEVNWG